MADKTISDPAPAVPTAPVVPAPAAAPKKSPITTSQAVPVIGGISPAPAASGTGRPDVPARAGKPASGAAASEDVPVESTDELASEAIIDWRVGYGTKAQKTLSRFTSPEAFYDAYTNLREKVSSKSVQSAKPGEGATEEEVAAWRESVGVPATSDGYNIKFSDGRILGDNDKPMLDTFTAAMHEVDAPPDVVSRAANWYFDQLERISEQQSEADDAFRQQSTETLKEKWKGPDFKRNVNAVGTLFVDAPQGLFDRIFGGRTADGHLIGDDPAIMEFLAGVALENNPAATIMPSGGGGHGQTVEGRLAEIMKIMQTNPDKYNADVALQKEELELLEARNKQLVRGKHAA